MPPAKGSLAANKAILSLFLAGPETHSNIKARLRREYGDARWSRSIVNSSIPALAEQGHVRLLREGEKRADDLYEITKQGVGEFRRYMRESPRAPAPLREPLQLWIEHSTPDELPVLLSVIRETELAASSELEAAQLRLHNDRALGKLGPKDGSDWNGRMRYAVLSDRVLYWQQRVERCMGLRQMLTGGRNMHSRRPAADHA